jgi:hypothetical protein
MAPKVADTSSKGDELYEARDLRIVPVDSPDPEVRIDPSRFARLESPFSFWQTDGSEPAGRKQNARKHSFPYPYIIRRIPKLSILPSHSSDRNLRFTIELSDFPEFWRVRVWTLGIRENAGMIRARSDSEWYRKTGIFEPCNF